MKTQAGLQIFERSNLLCSVVVATCRFSRERRRGSQRDSARTLTRHGSCTGPRPNLDPKHGFRAVWLGNEACGRDAKFPSIRSIRWTGNQEP
jgi:hypothetical protein